MSTKPVDIAWRAQGHLVTARLCLSGLRSQGAALIGCDLGQPVEPLRQVPVPVSQELHAGRKQDHSDNGRIDEDRDGQSNPELLEAEYAAGGEGGENDDHDRRGAGYLTRCQPNPRRHRRFVLAALVVSLLDAVEHQHVVAHREPEQDAEQEQREPSLDDARRLGTQDADPPPPLKYHHKHAVGRCR